jgi:hypothetical protein
MDASHLAVLLELLLAYHMRIIVRTEEKTGENSVSFLDRGVFPIRFHFPPDFLPLLDGNYSITKKGKRPLNLQLDG